MVSRLEFHELIKIDKTKNNSFIKDIRAENLVFPPGRSHGDAYSAIPPAKFTEDLEIERLREEAGMWRGAFDYSEDRAREASAAAAERIEELIRQHDIDKARIDGANATIRKANEKVRQLTTQLRVTRASEATAWASKSEAPDPDFAALGLDPRTAFVGLTEEQIQTVITSAQHARAKFSHPDSGGSTQKMKRINNAADALKKPSTRGNHKR